MFNNTNPMMNSFTPYPPGTKFVLYERVSTVNQINENLKASSKGKDLTSLNLENQLRSARRWIRSVEGKKIGEFYDIDSGAKRERHELNKALKLCLKDKGTVLVVSDLSRLSRGGQAIAVELDRLKIPFISYNSPNDNDLIKTIKLAIAKEEHENITSRIKRSKAEMKRIIKDNGYYETKKGRILYKLGEEEYLDSKKGGLNSGKIRREIADSNKDNIKATEVILAYRELGDTFKQLMERLNRRGFKTSKGNDFSITQVRNLYNRAIEAQNKEGDNNGK